MIQPKLISLRLRRCGILICGPFLLLGGHIAARGAERPLFAQAMQLAQEASAAEASDNPEAALEKLEAAVALRPDLPRLVGRLAVAQAAAERFEDALRTLEHLAAMGLGLTGRELDDLAILRSRPEFAEVMKQLAANLRTKGAGDLAFALREVTGVIEGIAWAESSGEFYFGDANGRAVWTRNKDNTLRRLTPEGDELLGVLGLAVDDARGALWAATSAVPVMRDYSSDQAGTAELAEIDLASGAIRRTIPVPAQGGTSPAHVLGDIALAENGSVYLTDRGAPIIWHLPSGGNALERFAESPEFMSLHGIVVMDGALIVADRLNGLLRVDLHDRSVELLEGPDDLTLVGMNGLVRTPAGQVLAIQGGVSPSRVLQLEVDSGASRVASASVLEAGHLTMAAPAQGCIGPNGDLIFIGNSGWARVEQNEGRPTAPRPVPVFKTKLGQTRK